MGFLDGIERKAIDSVLGSSSSPLAQQVLEMIHNHPGGLAGLVQSFHQNGLGEIVTSWVGTGQNQPISADQLQSVLGNEKVQELAARAGVPADVASSKLAQYLPMIIDRLTPNGQLPQSGDLMEMGESLLASLQKTGT